MKSIQRSLNKYRNNGILDILLRDRTTGQNIIWATDSYSSKGHEYEATQPIKTALITGKHTGVIRTRVERSKEEKRERTKKKAEVFTPSWIVRDMIDQVDDSWFGRKHVFLDEHGEPNKRVFGAGETDKALEYIMSNRMELTCGEAPYLVMRYDTDSGEDIDIPHRVGMLDRKLRVVTETTDSSTDWVLRAADAFRHTYGYEFQGDNLLIARVNLMETFEEYSKAIFRKRGPFVNDAIYKDIAHIISWNIWQMNGLTGLVPLADESAAEAQISLDTPTRPVRCRIMDWDNGKEVEYLEMVNHD